MKFQMTKEHLFYIGCSFVILVLNIIPYAAASFITPEGRIFSGQLYIYYDVPTYYAKMLAGFEGLFLYHNFYTTETPNPDIPIYLFYNLLGHLARIIHSDVVTVFFAARIFFGAVFLGSIAWFLTIVVPNVRIRIVSFAAICFASGFGWLALFLYSFSFFQTTQNLFLFPDLLIPEFMPFARFVFHPHILFAHTLFLVSLASAYRIFTVVRHLILTTCCLTISLSLLSLVLPFHLPAVYGMLLCMMLYSCCTTKSIQKNIKVGIACVISTIPVIWLSLLLKTAPLWSMIEKQNSVSALPFYSLVIGWGLLGLLAVRQLFILNKRKKINLSIVMFAAWIGIPLVLMYITPFVMKRRFSETGMFIPLSILASWWLVEYMKKSSFNFVTIKKWITLSLILVVGVTSNALTYQVVFLELVSPKESIKIFISKKTIDALRWVSYHTDPQSIVLGTLQTGNIIPVYARRHTFFGHIPETVDGKEKNMKVEAFYRGAMNEKQAHQFLLDNHISIVLVTEYEKERIKNNPKFPYPFLKELYNNGEARVFSVAY